MKTIYVRKEHHRKKDKTIIAIRDSEELLHKTFRSNDEMSECIDAITRYQNGDRNALKILKKDTQIYLEANLGLRRFHDQVT